MLCSFRLLGDTVSLNLPHYAFHLADIVKFVRNIVVYNSYLAAHLIIEEYVNFSLRFSIFTLCLNTSVVDRHFCRLLVRPKLEFDALFSYADRFSPDPSRGQPPAEGTLGEGADSREGSAAPLRDFLGRSISSAE
jgi:hypothetical protein